MAMSRRDGTDPHGWRVCEGLVADGHTMRVKVGQAMNNGPDARVLSASLKDPVDSKDRHGIGRYVDDRRLWTGGADAPPPNSCT